MIANMWRKNINYESSARYLHTAEVTTSSNRQIGTKVAMKCNDHHCHCPVMSQRVTVQLGVLHVDLLYILKGSAYNSHVMGHSIFGLYPPPYGWCPISGQIFFPFSWYIPNRSDMERPKSGS